MCMCFPKITQERDSNKSNTEMRFPDFGLEMLIAKIINMWQPGISAASFILKHLKVLCRLGKTKRSCFSWREAAISRLGCSRCLMLEKYKFNWKKELSSGFGLSWGIEGWKNSCRPRQRGVPPSHLAPSTRTPLYHLRQQIRPLLCFLYQITTWWGQAETRLLESLYPEIQSILPSSFS